MEIHRKDPPPLVLYFFGHAIVFGVDTIVFVFFTAEISATVLNYLSIDADGGRVKEATR